MPTASTRKTRQREALREVFEHAERPLTINELLDAASERVDGLGIATVYRAVGSLVEEGWIEPVEIAGEATRYERSDKGHHHHFRCESCERVFDIAGCLENIRKLVPAHFTVRSHDVTIYGLCPSCSH